MKEILLWIVISIQTLRGCIAQEIKLPQYDTQPPTNELLKYARAHTWKAYYREFKHNVFRFAPNMNKKTKKSFCKNFRRITKTETGKTLLCRIIIEIRKRQNVNLDIKSGNMEFSQGENDTPLALQFSTDRIKACVIDPKKYAKAADHLELSEDIKDNLQIHLFHELCHWFHFLSDQQRYHQDTEFKGGILDDNICSHYFKASKPKVCEELKEYDFEASLWSGYGDVISVEEIRTILGIPKDEHYQEGDDLCENIYRMEIGAPLRYGHLAYDHALIRSYGYTADLTVIHRVIRTCELNYISYK